MYIYIYIYIYTLRKPFAELVLPPNLELISPPFRSGPGPKGSCPAHYTCAGYAVALTSTWDILPPTPLIHFIALTASHLLLGAGTAVALACCDPQMRRSFKPLW